MDNYTSKSYLLTQLKNFKSKILDNAYLGKSETATAAEDWINKPEWIGEDKPSYTADEVGALPADTTIPTISNEYNKESEEGMSGIAVASALEEFNPGKTLTEEAYEALSEEEKMNGTTYYIEDGNEVVDASQVPFHNESTTLKSTNVQSAITELNSNISNKLISLDVNVGSVAITKSENGLYYSDGVRFDVPSGYYAVAATMYGGAFTSGVSRILIGASGYGFVHLTSSKSLTMPANRIVKVLLMHE